MERLGKDTGVQKQAKSVRKLLCCFFFFLQPPTTGGVRVCGGGALTHEGKRTIAEFLFALACTLLSKTLITSSLRPQQHDVSMCRLIMKPRKSNC